MASRDSDRERLEIDRRFQFHGATPITKVKHSEARARMRTLALWVLDNVPASRERSLALTHLQSAMMWSNAAIAIHTEPEVIRDRKDES